VHAPEAHFLTTFFSILWEWLGINGAISTAAGIGAITKINTLPQLLRKKFSDFFTRPPLI